mmetsp:Transcript_51159/g.136614  ORF Transcript_51159/g.136614 Transcript_51159/m.136614 type:complete len:209 (-) Transcript_51159:92-718(-)
MRGFGAMNSFRRATFAAHGRAAATRFKSGALYHGEVDHSVFDIHFKHVVLEFPDASAEQLGSRFALKFVEHYDEDLFRTVFERVIVQTGVVSPAHGGASLLTEAAKKTVHDVASLVPPESASLAEEVALDRTSWPHLPQAEAAFDELVGKIPELITLTLDEAPGNEEVQRVKYRLTPATRDSLARMCAGFYPSGVAASFLVDGRLAKV